MNPALPVDEESPIPDLRSWLEQVRQMGKLREVQGASWDLEVGALTDLNVKSRKWKNSMDSWPHTCRPGHYLTRKRS